MEHRYTLAPYTRTADWLICPNCNQRQLVPYVDTETGEILDPSCGRCNRESNCGYHLPPREFFKQNPGARPQGDAWKEPPAWLKNLPNRPRAMPQSAKPASSICVLPNELVERTILFEPRSNFVKFLDTLFDPLVVEGLTIMYNLGITKKGEVLFYQKDIKGRYRGGKILQYDPVLGKRIKKGGGIPVNWVHPLFKKRGFIPETWSMTQCVFGEHLLAEYPEKPVILVEAEKTAVVCCGFMPEYNWLATGGKTQLGEKLNVLKGYDVTALPDIDAVEYWQEYFAKFPGADIKVEDPYGEAATEEDRENQIDIADLLIRWHQSGEPDDAVVPTVPTVPLISGTGRPAVEYKSAVANMVAKCIPAENMPEVEALIEDFDLELVSVSRSKSKDNEDTNRQRPRP